MFNISCLTLYVVYFLIFFKLLIYMSVYEDVFSVNFLFVVLSFLSVLFFLCFVAQSCPTLCDLVDSSPSGSSVHGDSPGEKIGVGCHALLQGIFPTQGLNPGFPHCRRILYCLCHQRSPRILEWIAYPFSRGCSWPRNEPGPPALQADSLPPELPGKQFYIMWKWMKLKCQCPQPQFCPVHGSWLLLRYRSLVV